MRSVSLLLLMLLPGCEFIRGDGIERNCDTRQAFYPDADGDGIGDDGAIYVGCTAPEGYVERPPLWLLPDTDVPVDTDPVDTDPVDTDPADTDASDTDEAAEP